MASVRERARRINQGVFISGASGSGKSRMTARLAAPWNRVIYIDPMNSFDAEFTAQTPRDAARYLGARWKEPFSVKATFRADAQYLDFLQALLALMEHSQGSAPNFLLVIDEVDLWSGPKFIDTSLSRILRYGRHYGCSWIANCRADVHTNRDVRMNAQEILLFRQGMLSDEMRKQLADAEIVRDVKFPRTARLARHDDDGDADEGVHFIAIPEPFDDWLPTWHALADA